MFGDPEFAFPRRWSEMSLDYRLFFASHLVLMAMFIAGAALTLQAELVAEAVLVAVVALAVAWRRQRDGWQWAGAGPRQLLGAVFSLVVVIVFLGAAILLFPPNSPRALPWYLIGANIGLFNTLIALRVLRPSQSAYENDCRAGDKGAPVLEPPQPQDLGQSPWPRLIRVGYQGAFILVWIDGLAFFFAEGAAHPDPQSVKSFPLIATLAQKLAVLQDPVVHSTLEAVMFIGIPCVLLGGFFLQFVAGIQVLPNLPARRLWDAGDR